MLGRPRQRAPGPLAIRPQQLPHRRRHGAHLFQLPRTHAIAQGLEQTCLDRIHEIGGSGSLGAHRIPVSETGKFREHGPSAKVTFKCWPDGAIATPPLPSRNYCHRPFIFQSRCNDVCHCGGVAETGGDDLSTWPIQIVLIVDPFGEGRTSRGTAHSVSSDAGENERTVRRVRQSRLEPTACQDGVTVTGEGLCSGTLPPAGNDTHPTLDRGAN